MTTQITNPTDDEAFPTTPSFDEVATRSGAVQLMFSPTSTAEMGQFETEAEPE